MPHGPTRSTVPSPADTDQREGVGPASHRLSSRLSRRGVLGAAGAVAVAAGVVPAVSAATGPDESGGGPDEPTPTGTTARAFPATRAEESEGGTADSAPFPIGWVATRWEGPADGGRIRLDSPGKQGSWTGLGPTCSTSNGGGHLISADGANGYRVEAPAGADALRTRALDTTDGPRRAVAVPKDTTRVRGLAYLSRAAWGADESKRFKPDGSENSPPVYYPFQTVTVHHTDTPNQDADPAATVRAVYEYHAIDNDWGDIGYHFLIDEQGRVYEGRWSGKDGLPAHDSTGKLVTAFHVGGFNSGNLGIALLGNLQKQAPTDAARQSLTSLVRVLTRLHGLDPQTRLSYVNPVNGTTKEVDALSGHRDWLETDCPGAVMYEELAALRERVANRA